MRGCWLEFPFSSGHMIKIFTTSGSSQLNASTNVMIQLATWVDYYFYRCLLMLCLTSLWCWFPLMYYPSHCCELFFCLFFCLWVINLVLIPLLITCSLPLKFFFFFSLDLKVIIYVKLRPRPLRSLEHAVSHAQKLTRRNHSSSPSYFWTSNYLCLCWSNNANKLFNNYCLKKVLHMTLHDI